MKSINKETITEVALDLFLKEGFNNVTVNQICEHCNITKPTFYKYVNSKDDLILNLYDQTISNILGDTYHLPSQYTSYRYLNIYLLPVIMRLILDRKICSTVSFHLQYTIQFHIP